MFLRDIIVSEIYVRSNFICFTSVFGVIQKFLFTKMQSLCLHSLINREGTQLYKPKNRLKHQSIKTRHGQLPLGKHYNRRHRTKPSDKGIGNRTRQLSTPKAHQARPNCNISRNTSSYRMSIVICIGSLPIPETWPPIYRGQEGTVRDILKASQVYTHVYFRWIPCLTDFTFEYIRRPISPILSPSSRTFVELTLVNWCRPWGLWALES
jgi:hypothetical protein